MKHLKLFQTEAEYSDYKNGSDFITPNVSYTVNSTKVYYSPHVESGSNAIKVSWIETPVDLSISLGLNPNNYFSIYDENDQYASGFKYTTKENKDKIQGNYYYFEYDDEYIDVTDSTEEEDTWSGQMKYSITLRGKKSGEVQFYIYAGSKEYGEYVDSSLIIYIN